MSYNFYKVLHLAGVLMIFLSLGAAIVRGQVTAADDANKKFFGMLNGLGLLIALVAGFGLIAKLGMGFGGWIAVKILIWVLLGGALAIANRKPALARPLTLVAIVLGTLAAYLGLVKPF